MNNQQQTRAGGADAQQQFLDKQASIFLFDLKNEATEHGFKSDGSWALELATDNEMTELRKIHHPVISLKLQANALLKVYQQVKSRLHQSLNTADLELSDIELATNEKKHLAAFPVRK